jgi:hypothetical protein
MNETRQDRHHREDEGRVPSRSAILLRVQAAPLAASVQHRFVGRDRLSCAVRLPERAPNAAGSPVQIAAAPDGLIVVASMKPNAGEG